MERKVAESHPHTAIFCGDGGDSGFGGECISLAVDDLLRLKGLVNGIGSGMIRLASQVALRTDSLTWSVLRRALRRRRLGSSMHDHREKLLMGAALANREVRAAALRSSQYPHPWFAACDHVPWHVIGRLGNLLGSPESNDPFLSPDAFSPYIAAPLYSQPVVELCLRIPVYTHFHRGHERGLARTAFQQEVPLPILRRQWKDRAPGAFEDLVRRNRAYISEILLGGVLYRDGFLDRDATRNALSGAISSQQFQVGEILNYLHLENWLRHFEGPSIAT
jgi:asparagine synthase (glutamine-hydrolysing)